MPLTPGPYSPRPVQLQSNSLYLFARKLSNPGGPRLFIAKLFIRPYYSGAPGRGTTPRAAYIRTSYILYRSVVAGGRRRRRRHLAQVSPQDVRERDPLSRNMRNRSEELLSLGRAFIFRRGASFVSLRAVGEVYKRAVCLGRVGVFLGDGFYVVRS